MWKFIRKKKQRGRKSNVAENLTEPVDVSDLESLYSLDDEPSDSVLCIIAYSDLSSNNDSDSNSPENHYWKPHHQNFMAANGEKFVIDNISVPIDIRLFPKYVIKRRILGSSSHGKDLLIGFDILHKLPNLRYTSEGLHYRSFFNPWTAMHRLFKKSLFQHLADARVLSKFDLKSGFWQLAFQKAMITIFEPILANTLVYIDDILLFSPDEQSHAELLSKFYSLVMLSEKKIEVGVTTIQFLGMEIFDGKYYPQPHVAQELLKFPDVNPSSKKCEKNLQTLYTDTRGLMAIANGVDPDKIPYHVMWNISIWSKDHPDAYKWIKANGQWLYDNFDHYEVETSNDDDDARSLWSSDDDEHFDPFEDDPTHLDARWSP
nr:RNA-directed DNA polymerase homolog [Tanacetum cinerariifolium]